MIAIIDYDVGNIHSIKNAFEYCAGSGVVHLVSDPYKLKDYSKIVLPGVGAFSGAMESIVKKNFDEAIKEEIKKGKYLLGICLGMQLLATKSYEHGEYRGLDIISGEVIGFNSGAENLKIPHIGWNDVVFTGEDRLVSGIKANSDFYFLHSYFFKYGNESDVLGMTEYGIKFSSIIHRDNIYGVQFHPEKSQEEGLKIIKNFLELK